MPTRKIGYGSFSIGFVCGFCLYYAVPLPAKWAIRSAHQIEDSRSAAVPIISTPATPLWIDFERTQPEPLAEQDILDGAPSVTFGRSVLKRYSRSRDPSLLSPSQFLRGATKRGFDTDLDRLGLSSQASSF
jgi:hypothetical protein